MSDQLEIPNDDFNSEHSESATPALGEKAIDEAEVSDIPHDTPEAQEQSVADEDAGQDDTSDDNANDATEDAKENSEDTPEESAGSTRKSKSKKKRRRRPRLSEEERAVLWHKAIIRKAKKLKNFTDVLLMLTLAIIISTHFIPQTPLIDAVPWHDKDGMPETTKRATGFEICKRLLTEHKVTRLVTRRHDDGKIITREVGDQLIKDRRIYTNHDAHPVSYGILAIGIGAALILLLYLLDYLVWMGRLLPLLSMLWGGSGVLYLIYTRVLIDGKWPGTGVWSVLGYGSAAKAAWYLILISLFMHAVFALLRFVVSQRWKRYEYAGLPVPDKCKPKNYPELTDKSEDDNSIEQNDDLSDIEDTSNEAEDDANLENDKNEEDDDLE